MRNYLTSKNYRFDFDVNGDAVGYSNDPFDDGTLAIDAFKTQDNQDHYLMFQLDQN